MYYLMTLARYKTAVIVGTAIALAALLAPAAFAQQQDLYGVAPIEQGLGGSLGKEDLRTTVARVINVALSLLGVIAVVIILIGGFRWMTAGGNDDKVAEARKWIFSGIIGLAVILSAWAIARFVLSSLSTATRAPGAVPVVPL